MHFSNTEKGRKELEKSRKIYANHKKIVMIAREEVSYQSMKKEFAKNNVIKTKFHTLQNMGRYPILSVQNQIMFDFYYYLYPQ